MGMPVIVAINGLNISDQVFEDIFSYFNAVDEKFSTYKSTSEISAFQSGVIRESEVSEDVKFVFKAASEMKERTNGFFDITTPQGVCDPSGFVKGWALKNVATSLRSQNITNFYLEIGGDIQTSGINTAGVPWTVGIQNPFTKKQESIKTLHLHNKGIATSGTYARGQHIYNPTKNVSDMADIMSITVVGADVCEADCYATAAFAMGTSGIDFIEKLDGFEGYLIQRSGIAVMTSGFEILTT